MWLTSPLEQFEIRVLQPFYITNYIDLSFTNASWALLLSTTAILFFLSGAIFHNRLIPFRWQSVGEFFYHFVLGMVKQQAGRAGYFLFPIFLFTFFFIFFCNLFGLFPLGFTPTGHNCYYFYFGPCF